MKYRLISKKAASIDFIEYNGKNQSELIRFANDRLYITTKYNRHEDYIESLYIYNEDDYFIRINIGDYLCFENGKRLFKATPDEMKSIAIDYDYDLLNGISNDMCRNYRKKSQYVILYNEKNKYQFVQELFDMIPNDVSVLKISFNDGGELELYFNKGKYFFLNILENDVLYIDKKNNIKVLQKRILENEYIFEKVKYYKSEIL